jgi:mannose-6-phosphate isomerase-like protein (cupin superfamily)
MASPAAGFAVARDGGERLEFAGATIFVRASAETTGGSFTVIEEAPPLLDTPLHVHEREDEIFFVLEGEHVITCGAEEFRLGPGDMAFAPRGVPHAQRRVVPGEGRLLIMTSPAGFEGFMRELAAAEREGRLGPEAYAAASERYGISWLS